jgi:hypothetical protein
MAVTRVAVAALTKGYADLNEYKMLISRNISLSKTKNNEGLEVHYILFHEGNITTDHQEYIRKETPDLDIRFIDVSEEFHYIPSNKGISNGICRPTCTSRAFSHGYKSMCRFWLHRFLEYTDGYDYVVRVDEDCIIKSMPLSLIISDMQSRDFVYMTPLLLDADGEEVTMGLDKVSTDFAKDRGLPPPIFNKNPYTNVFIMNSKFFKGNSIFKDFCNVVDDTGCIYANRWGDLPMWGIILSMIMPGSNSKWGVENRIRYYHGSHSNHIN